MRRPLKLGNRSVSAQNRMTGSALADEEAIETFVPPKLVGGVTAAGSALADEEAIETQGVLASVANLPRPAVPWPMRRPLKP